MKAAPQTFITRRGAALRARRRGLVQRLEDHRALLGKALAEAAALLVLQIRMQLLLGGEDDDTEATKAFESSPLFAIDPATSTPPSSRRSTARPVSSSCGAEVWRSTYNNVELSLNDDAQGLALGPGFAVAAGSEQVLGEGYNVWVRAFYVP